MGRARNPDRDKARELWLNAEPDTLKVKDIAAQLGYPENTVRKWKSEDHWEKERSEKIKRSAPLSERKKGAPKGNTNASGHGAPTGNSNAVGNKGGAPKGSQNAFKHGGYASILFDTLEEDERSLIDEMEANEEQMLIDEINLLTVRERRIMKRIEEAQKTPLGVASSVRTDHKRVFDSEEDETLYRKMIREKIDKGERLPGREYTTHTTTEASYSIVLKLEEALTRCQAQKQRAIDSLNKIRQSKGSKGGALADDWIAGVLESMEEADDD